MEVAVATHGVFGGWGADPPLSEQGMDQAVALTGALAERFGGRHILVLTSPAQRATMTTGVVSDNLNAAFREHDFLGPQAPADQTELKLREWIAKLQAEGLDDNRVLVVITHAEHVQALVGPGARTGFCEPNFIEVEAAVAA